MSSFRHTAKAHQSGHHCLSLSPRWKHYHFQPQFNSPMMYLVSNERPTTRKTQRYLYKIPSCPKICDALYPSPSDNNNIYRPYPTILNTHNKIHTYIHTYHRTKQKQTPPQTITPNPTQLTQPPPYLTYNHTSPSQEQAPDTTDFSPSTWAPTT